MEETQVMKLSKVLKILVTVTFACNLLTLFCVPGLVLMGGPMALFELTVYEVVWEVPVRVLIGFALSWRWVWQSGGYDVVLTLFLFFCGCCTAVILWQARRVLDAILEGETFTMANANNMKRAAVCCLLISCAAFARMLWGFTYYRSIRPLLTYNALFIPIFAMGFLLCMVMSALFRQAAELKTENDLTI